MEDIQKKLIEIFKACLSLELTDAEIEALTRQDCPKWDSMGHLNLILASEEAFGISIPEETGAKLASFWGFVAAIEDMTNAKR